MFEVYFDSVKKLKERYYLVITPLTKVARVTICEFNLGFPLSVQIGFQNYGVRATFWMSFSFTFTLWTTYLRRIPI